MSRLFIICVQKKVHESYLGSGEDGLKLADWFSILAFLPGPGLQTEQLEKLPFHREPFINYVIEGVVATGG